MLRNALLIIVLFMGMTLLFLKSQGADLVQLRYNYPEGKNLIYKFEEWSDMERPDGTVKNISEFISTEQFKSDDKSGPLRISVVLSDTKESTQLYGQIIMRNEIGIIAGEQFLFDLAPNGTITKFTPPSVEKFILKHDLEALEIMMSNLKLSFSDFYPRLPNNPVKVGDSWTAEDEINLDYPSLEIQGKGLESRVFKVKNEKKKDGFGCFSIDEKTQLTLKAVFNFIKFMVVVEGTGTKKGEFLFDYERGLAQKYEASYKMDAQAMILGEPDVKPIKSKFEYWYKRELKKIQ